MPDKTSVAASSALAHACLEKVSGVTVTGLRYLYELNRSVPFEHAVSNDQHTRNRSPLDEVEESELA